MAACLIAAWSCSKCFIGNCPYDDTKFIQFYSQADSTDLITTGKFKLDSLTITPLLVNAAGPVPEYEISFSSPYAVAIYASANAAGFVFQLDSLPPDTLLTIVGFQKGTKCCDNGINTFEQVILNGDTLPQARNDYNIPLFK